MVPLFYRWGLTFHQSLRLKITLAKPELPKTLLGPAPHAVDSSPPGSQERAHIPCYFYYRWDGRRGSKKLI